MTRLLVSAAAMILSVSPTLAADNAADNRAAGSDQSTGPKQQSSAPPDSDAAKYEEMKSTEGASGDSSTGAMEQSSSPPGSSAADGKPNPSSNTTPN